VFGGYLVLYPTSRIGTLIGVGFLYFPVRIYAWAFIVFWFLLQLVTALRASAPTWRPVAAWRIGLTWGGFPTGVVLIRLFAHPGRVQQLDGVRAQPA
jgi:rhomboid family protein